MRKNDYWCCVSLPNTIVTAGKLKQTERADPLDRREQDRTVWGRMINKSHLHNGYCCYHSRHVYRPVRFSYPLDKITIFHGGVSFYEKIEPLQSFQGIHSSKNFYNENLRQRTLERPRCLFSSFISSSNLLGPRKHNNLGFSGNKSKQLERHSLLRTHSSFQPGEYELTSSEVDSFISPDEPNEAPLSETDSEKVSSSSSQFPKRWVIVLLCFAAFLLCNMDRVGF